jgi:prepilin-type N-terminal cleavage/methylation domain-containing protein/prepilin-type processing-associated H-X9-DG protein
MGYRQHKSAFTLIELLVVIAIIAILAAILFPVFASAREKARSIACLSNMKQLGLGFMQYNQDYDEREPTGVNWYTPGGNGWASQLYAYIKSTNVFVCPDDSTTNVISSYSYNSNNVTPTGTTVTAASISTYLSPSKTILLSEVVGNGDPNNAFSVALDPSNALSDGYSSGGRSAAGYGTFINGVGYFTSPVTLKYATGWVRNSDTEYYGQAAHYYYSAKAGRHNGGANYVLADGHAKFLQPNAVSAGSENLVNTDCGNTGLTDASGYLSAAGTDCGDSTIAATFSRN